MVIASVQTCTCALKAMRVGRIGCVFFFNIFLNASKMSSKVHHRILPTCWLLWLYTWSFRTPALVNFARSWTSAEDIHSFHLATLDSHENDFGHTLPFHWEKWTIFDSQLWAIWTGHRLRYIEDPFDLKHNLAGRCSAAGWAKPCQRLMLMWWRGRRKCN